MTRRQLRHPVALTLAGLGWALILLIYLPALASLLPVRVIWGDAVVIDAGGCLNRLSSRGVLHTPESPHWGQTGTTRCLDQE